MAPDLRSALEAVAAGRTLTNQAAAANIVDPALLKAHQPAFRAWNSFARASRAGKGEPLAAPSEILTPLP